MRKEGGITLIALVVTIIMLLILAGVSLNAIAGDGGLIAKATEASKKSKAVSEKEAIEFIVSDIKIGLMIGEEIPKSKYLGEELKNRQPGDWGIITVGEKAYGTDWYFLEKGKEITSYGKSNFNWLINYNTGEIVELEEGNYSKLSSNDTVIESCKNNIIFTLDASSIGKATKVEDLESGDVDFIGFEDTNENSGLTENSFKFDGINDYIKVTYDDTAVDDSGLTKKDTLAQNGFTLEFCGKLKSWDEEDQIVDGVYRRGLFYFGKKEPSTLLDVGIRCFLDKDLNNKYYFTWSAGWNAMNPETREEYLSDYRDSNSAYIIKYPLNEETISKINNNEVICLTFTFDVTDKIKSNNIDYLKATLYESGNKICEAKYSEVAWNDFLTTSRWINGDGFQIGRVMAGKDGQYVYSKMDAYTLRLYNRALTVDEVKKSYQNSLILLK